VAYDSGQQCERSLRQHRSVRRVATRLDTEVIRAPPRCSRSPGTASTLTIRDGRGNARLSLSCDSPQPAGPSPTACTDCRGLRAVPAISATIPFAVSCSEATREKSRRYCLLCSIVSGNRGASTRLCPDTNNARVSSRRSHPGSRSRLAVQRRRCRRSSCGLGCSTRRRRRRPSICGNVQDGGSARCLPARWSMTCSG